MRNADRAQSTEDANRMHANRNLFYSTGPDGMTRISAELPPEVGSLFVKAMEIAISQLESDGENSNGENEADVSAETYPTKQLDALTAILSTFLSGDRCPGQTADTYQVMIHVDEVALSTARSDLPVETVKRVCCDMDNLLLLCSKHHRLLHEGGYQIKNATRASTIS